MFALPRLFVAPLLFAAAAALAVTSSRADGPGDNAVEKVRPVPPPGIDLPAADAEEIKKGLAELQSEIKAIGTHELLPDVQVYEKAVRYAVEHKQVFDAKGIPAVKNVLKTGLERAKALKDGKTPWTTATGPVLRGYKSKIDGSAQPYWMLVPKEYDFAAKTPHRLDFWWHGRGETLSEVNFMAGSPGTGGIIPQPGMFILHPYGRYCCANKLAGEVDTFECLDHAKKAYRIDENRLVARGFSMGGAACWQYAVHYPTLWCANAPGAGFSETPEFLKVFQKEDTTNAPWYEKKLWHMYNATDYAANIFNLPTVAYSGEVDSQKQAADVMAREMKKEGLDLVHIIGPKTGHSYEKAAKIEVNTLIDAAVAKGKPALPPELRFVTYTLRYNQCGRIAVLGLKQHWERGSVTAKYAPGKLDITTKGITAFSVTAPLEDPRDITIDGVKAVARVGGEGFGYKLFFKLVDGKWTDWDGKTAGLAKSPGLQGPIDDAFLDSFVMVKPTGKAANETAGAWAEAEMAHAVDHWRKQYRGDAPVKADTAIDEADIAKSNLILWGDPSSNAVLAKIADKLPVKWTAKGVQVGDQTYAAATHVPVLIYPNPFNPKKYVVLNSGFTFREYDYLNNARQVPKLPDYAVLDITTPPNARYPGKVVRAGFFGEKWELLPDDGK